MNDGFYEQDPRISSNGNIDADTPTIAWRIDPEVTMNTLAPSMVIQFPVENAIK